MNEAFINALLLSLTSEEISAILKTLTSEKVNTVSSLKENAFRLLWIAILKDELERREYKD